MKNFWWLLDEWGCMNFFDNHESYLYARNNYPGMMEGCCFPGDVFEAESVKGCWKLEELKKYEKGYLV